MAGAVRASEALAERCGRHGVASINLGSRNLVVGRGRERARPAHLSETAQSGGACPAIVLIQPKASSILFFARWLSA